MAGVVNTIRANLMHAEHGWKTTHFWGPVANWGLVGAAVYDATYNGPEKIDLPMVGTMWAYSATFLRFFWAVIPRNPLGMACHVFNIAAQSNQIRRAAEYKSAQSEEGRKEVEGFAKLAAGAGVTLMGLIAGAGPMARALSQPTMPSFVQTIGKSPVGPFTVFFWAPASKWALSGNNLIDLRKDTNKMSMANQIALSVTGLIWTRYSLVITPINYNLAAVNFVLGISSIWHLQRKVRNDYIGESPPC
jgi:mitochondrial pyruvate carrier 2